MRRTLMSMVLTLALAFVALSNYAIGQATYLKSGPTSLTETSASCIATACVRMAVTAETQSVTVQLAGTFSATVTFEATGDGTNWTTVGGYPVTGGSVATTATTTGIWRIGTSGFAAVRARVSAYTSGTVSVTLTRSASFSPQANVVNLGADLTVNSMTSSGAVSGTTGTFSGAVSTGALTPTTLSPTGVITPAAAAGVAPISGANYGIWTAGYSPAALTSGTDTVGVANQMWIAPVWVPANMTITGVGVLVGTVGGTDKAIVALYSGDGQTKLANSTTAASGTTVGSAGTLQSLAFTSPYAAKGPGLYWVSVQTSGTTARIRTIPLGTALTKTAAAGGAAPTSTITLPTSFAADSGPVAVLY